MEDPSGGFYEVEDIQVVFSVLRIGEWLVVFKGLVPDKKFFTFY